MKTISPTPKAVLVAYSFANLFTTSVKVTAVFPSESVPVDKTVPEAIWAPLLVPSCVNWNMSPTATLDVLATFISTYERVSHNFAESIKELKSQVDALNGWKKPIRNDGKARWETKDYL